MTKPSRIVTQNSHPVSVSFLQLPPPGPEIRREMERIWRHNWRALRRGRPAALTIHEWLDVLNRHQWACAYCSGPFESIDHVVSLHRGGGTLATNVVPACKSCNSMREQVETAIDKLNHFVAAGHRGTLEDLLVELML